MFRRYWQTPVYAAEGSGGVDTAESIAVKAVQASTEAVQEAQAAADEAAASAAEVVPAAAKATIDAMEILLRPIAERLDAIEARVAALTPPDPDPHPNPNSGPIEQAGETIVKPIEPVVDAVENTGSLAVVGVETTVAPARRATRHFYRI